MVHVVIFENDVESLDRWGYLLQSFGIPASNCWFPMAYEKFKWQAKEGFTIDRPTYVFQPDIGVNIQGEVSLCDTELDEDCILVFGGDHQHMTPAILDQFLPGWEDRCTKVFIPQYHDTAMHASNAGAIALWKWREANGWHGN